MQIDYGFRYSNTLYLNFKIPFAITSYGFETDNELKVFYEEYEPEYSFDTLKKCNSIEDDEFEDIIRKVFKHCIMEDTFDIDCRDDLEIEIHGIDQEQFKDSSIQELNEKLTKLCEDNQIKIE
ncbi:MAG: hypothetical protein WC554_07100 [Clostridia bacterium]